VGALGDYILMPVTTQTSTIHGCGYDYKIDASVRLQRNMFMALCHVVVIAYKKTFDD